MTDPDQQHVEPASKSALVDGGLPLEQVVDPAHETMGEDGVTVTQLGYEYSGAVLDQLRGLVALPVTLVKAVLRRQVDFLAGRWCAQRALQAAGFEGAVEIAHGQHGAPIWPPNFLGSISHCDGFAMASVARVQHIQALGIDVERQLSADVAREIQGQLATHQELAIGRGSMSPEAWLTVLFSGKESLFKALYPGVGRYFDFLDATALQLDAGAGTFTLVLRVQLSPRHPQGSTYPIRFHWNGDRVFTRCVVRPPASDREAPRIEIRDLC
jgi:enterobactin synthetase component D